MRQAEFLETLRHRLTGLPPDDVEDLIDDYAAHFADGAAAGRSEEEIAAALGDPMRLARELRAEAGFRRWETQRSPTNFLAVLLGFLALVAVDFVLLLPALFGFLLFTMILGFVVLGLCLGGFGLVLGQFGPGFFSVHTAHEILTGIALLGFGVGGGALLVLIVDLAVKLLAGFARVHYTLIDQGRLAA